MPRELPSSKSGSRSKIKNLPQRIGEAVDTATMSRMPEDFQRIHRKRKKKLDPKSAVRKDEY